MLALAAVIRPAEPAPGWGNLIALLVAAGVAYLAITTHQRYRPAEDDSQDDTSPPPPRRGRKPLPRGLSERHATIDTAREQARRKSADSRDRQRERGDSRSGKGRQRDDSRPSRWEQARNVLRYGALVPPETPEFDDDPEDLPEELPPDDEGPLFHPYIPSTARATETAIDLDLDDEPADMFEPLGPEPLRDYAGRLDLAGVAFSEIVAAVAEHYDKSESTTARALREARAARRGQS